jgi:hypothetical protein
MSGPLKIRRIRESGLTPVRQPPATPGQADRRCRTGWCIQPAETSPWCRPGVLPDPGLTVLADLHSRRSSSRHQAASGENLRFQFGRGLSIKIGTRINPVPGPATARDAGVCLSVFIRVHLRSKNSLLIESGSRKHVSAPISAKTMTRNTGTFRIMKSAINDVPPALPRPFSALTRKY